jgi:hypothetical protein
LRPQRKQRRTTREANFGGRFERATVDFLAIILLSIVATAHAASDYGRCAGSIIENSSLIAPVRPVVSSTKISPEIDVLLIKGPEDPNLGDSIVPITKQYESKVHSVFESLAATSAWIGIVEGVDGNGDPALWMHVWINTQNGCVEDSVGDRVYDRRVNAPTIFWDAIWEWEKAHPLSALVPAG